MQQEKYTIEWNTFQNHLQETQKELYIQKHFVDVTLVSDDMVKFHAHRTILCGASSIFKQLLMMDPKSTNTTLFLKGIKHEELDSILQFIYLGEANVYENRFNLFVSASKELDIEELNKAYEEDITEETKTVESTVEQDQPIVEHDLKIDYPLPYSNTSDKCPECNLIFSCRKNIKRHYITFHGGGGQNYACSQCQKVFTSKFNLDRHIKSVHEGMKL